MRNMTPYDLDHPFEVYKDTVERKKDINEKKELQSIERPIRNCYSLYDRFFVRNVLEHMPRSMVGVNHKAVLLCLYGSQTKTVKDFRKRFFEINPQTYNNLCPYCVINSSNTTEHILPKEQYPEYAINVKNLIPSCGECNTAKGEIVLDKNRKKTVINFYTDILPDEQFLFVDITNNGRNLGFKYFLSNQNMKIYPALYALIERHFATLHLLDRYDIKAIQEFAEVRNMYTNENFADELQYDAFAAKQLRKCDLDVAEYGRNHWKVVLLRACADSIVFKNHILSLP